MKILERIHCFDYAKSLIFIWKYANFMFGILIFTLSITSIWISARIETTSTQEYFAHSLQLAANIYADNFVGKNDAVQIASHINHPLTLTFMRQSYVAYKALNSLGQGNYEDFEKEAVKEIQQLSDYKKIETGEVLEKIRVLNSQWGDTGKESHRKKELYLFWLRAINTIIPFLAFLAIIIELLKIRGFGPRVRK